MDLIKSSSAGTTNPGGSDKQIQYNNSGSFAGDAQLIWDKTNYYMGIGKTPGRALDIKSKAGIGECMIQLEHTDSTKVFKMFQDNTNATFETTGPFQQINGTTGSPQDNKMYCQNFNKYRNDGTLDFQVHGDGKVQAHGLTTTRINDGGAKSLVTKEWVEANFVAI